MRTIDELLETNIKDIIVALPPVAEVLARYDIACTTCQAGTCRLHDIVEMHPLSPENERALIGAIAAIVFPGKSITIPAIERKQHTRGTSALSPPLRLLVAEHVHIMNVVRAIPRLVEGLEARLERQEKILRDAIAFIRGYADTFHHAKEEDLLFNLFEDSSDAVAAMLTDHDTGRAHVRETIAGLDGRNPESVKEHMLAYAALLTDHIHKEDDILYPWMDRRLSDSQIGKIYSRSLEIAQQSAQQVSRYEAFAPSLA